MQHSFAPKDLPPRPATAFAARLRTLTHGAPSAPHTSAASLFAFPTPPSSGDTGYLDTSRMGSGAARLGELPPAKDTRGSALLRATRAAGAGAGSGGGVLSAREARVVVEAEAAERAGGASARAAFLATAAAAQRPGSARNFFADTARRVPTDGRPCSSTVYSTYTVVGGTRR